VIKILKIIKNPNYKIYESVKQSVKGNGGYCPCLIQKNEDTKCMCKSFREQNHVGECHCGLYVKINI